MNFLRNLIQGSQSASKVDSGQKKKGPAAAPGLAGPLGNLEQKAEGQRDTPVITQENTSSNSPPSSPGSPTSEGSSHRECDTTSATDDPSFASCLTEEPSSVSELSPASPVKDSTRTASVVESSGCEARRQTFPTNSVSDSVTQNNTQNGVEKDSEYESAEEIDLPPDPIFVVEDHSLSASFVSPSPVTDESKCTEQEVSVSLDVIQETRNPLVQEDGTYTERKTLPVVDSLLYSTESTPVTVDKESDKLAHGKSEYLPRTICESVITVTRSEILEESVSEKTLPVEQVTKSRLKSETNEDIKSTSIAQSTEKGNLVVTLENRTLTSDVPSDITVRSESFPSALPLENFIESEVKGNEALLETFQENEVGKVKESDTQFESHLDNEILSQANKNKDQSELQHLSHLLSEKNKGESLDNSANILVKPELPKVEESQQDIFIEENHTEQASLEEEFKHDIDTFDTPKEEHLPSSEFIDPNDIPIPPQKSYNLDFLDNIDDPNFNPFATKTVIRSSPPPSPTPGCELPPLKPTVRKKKVTKEDKNVSGETSKNETKVLNASKNLAESEWKQVEPEEVLKQVKDEGLLELRSKPVTDGCSLNTSEIQPEEVEQLEKSQNLLEITFDDQASPVSRPPRKLGKKTQLKQQRQPVKKTPAKSKIIERNNNRVEEITPEPELPIPKSKGYDLDFLDKLEDPNFNPFVTKCSVRNSPPKEGFTFPEDKDKSDIDVVPANKHLVRKGFTVTKNQSQTKELEISDTSSTGNEENITAIPDLGTDTNKLEDKPLKPTEGEIPSPKQGYNLDFLDDPDFDPFQSRSALEKNLPSSKIHSTSEQVPRDNYISNAVIKEEDSPCECVQDDILDLQKQSQNNNQEQVFHNQKEESEGLTVQVDTQAEEKQPEVIEEKSQIIRESDQISSGQLQGCEEKPKFSEELQHTVNNRLQVTEEKFEFVENPSQINGNTHTSEEVNQGFEDLKLNSVSKVNTETEESAVQKSTENISDVDNNVNLPKVPSIGTIGQLDSLEFAQLLGNEASRLAEEFMNCSTDSGLPDSDDSSYIRSGSLKSTMADTSCTKSPQYGTHLDESVNPFQKHSRISRSPPLGKRGTVCGAESGDAHVLDPYKARRPHKRESVMGEERSDNVSLDDDSGIVLGTHLETEVNHSEAGPEIATGLTSSDLRCASQFFKQASDMENQLRRSLASPLLGSHSKLSGDEVTPTKEKKEPQAIKEPSVITPESPQNKPVPSTSSPAPPREERSAPEGTSSPTPRPSDTSEHKPSSSRPASVPPEGYMTAAEVQELIKRQELKFEEKLLQAELAAGEKEKKLRQAMKDEQKERNHLGENLAELTQSRDALLKMVGQYKDMLASLVSEKEKDKQGAEERIKAVELERNQALEDLANVEVAFSDVHRKYERTKQVVDTLRRNEETLRGAVADYESKLQKQEQKFVEFQKHAEEKIQLANEEFEAMRKSNDQEMTKMAALLKKAEMKIMSLQDAFDRKTRENQELTQLCDDLINKVGTSH